MEEPPTVKASCGSTKKTKAAAPKQKEAAAVDKNGAQANASHSQNGVGLTVRIEINLPRRRSGDLRQDFQEHPREPLAWTVVV
jgi:hypothetical protein